jgi:hypothetical protein
MALPLIVCSAREQPRLYASLEIYSSVPRKSHHLQALNYKLLLKNCPTESSPAVDMLKIKKFVFISNTTSHL